MSREVSERAARVAPASRGSAPDAPIPNLVEQRIRFEPDGSVTAFSGKIEFGQGIRTAFAQIVAEELRLDPERVRMVMGDTAQVPFDRGTFGSRSIAQDGDALRKAAAYAREQLLRRASEKLGVARERLTIADGAVRDGGVRDGSRGLTYAALAADPPLAGEVPDDVPLTPASEHRVLGRPRARVEARDIVTGRATYVADVRLDGMLHGKRLQPPVRGARLRSLDDAAARAMPGVGVVRDGDFAGVVAERAAQAQAALDALEADWTSPNGDDQQTVVIPMREDDGVDAALASAAHVVEASYVLPYISNAPIGPSAAVADVRADEATIYAGTQRPFGLRTEIASALGLAEERVRVVPRMPSGTYGRNSVGDASFEAAMLSLLAKRPVLVQWTREEEFTYAPARPAAVLDAKVGVGADGSLVAWRYDEHTNAHGYGFAVDPRVAPFTSGRNAIPPYRFGKGRITLHIEPTPVRTASFRSLAAAENVFAIESLLDELAFAARTDPLTFRLRHIDDPRLRRVVEAVAERATLGERSSAGLGKGLACTIYHGTYCAQVAEVVIAANGTPRLTRFWCAVDPGLVVNPDGVRNQIEGGIQQSASWTLLEELGQRDGRITTTGWDTYPIATFRDAPEEIDVHVMGDEAKPSTGVGEPGTVPVAAAIANAIFAACGARVRELPIGAERVRRARPNG